MKGHTLWHMGRHEEAVEALGQAIELDPTQVNFFVEQGTLFYNLGRYEEALAAFEQALALDPTLAEGLEKKAASLLKLERL